MSVQDSDAQQESAGLNRCEGCYYAMPIELPIDQRGAQWMLAALANLTTGSAGKRWTRICLATKQRCQRW